MGQGEAGAAGAGVQDVRVDPHGALNDGLV